MYRCTGGSLAIVPLAALAALGWWVLRVNAKDPAGAVKWAGRIVGWALVLFGLSGAVCAGVNHVRCALGGAACATGMGQGMVHCDYEGMRGGMLPPGHPPVGGAQDDGSKK